MEDVVEKKPRGRKPPEMAEIIKDIITRCAEVGLERHFVQILLLLRPGREYDIPEIAGLGTCTYAQAQSAMASLELRGFVRKEKQKRTYDDYYLLPKRGRPKYKFIVVGDDNLRKQILLEELEAIREESEKRIEKVTKALQERIAKVDALVEDVEMVFSE